MLAPSLAGKDSARSDLLALSRQEVPIRLLVLANSALALAAFHDPLVATIDVWLHSPEYNYGVLVPLVVALMLWRDLARSRAPRRGGWLGAGLVAVGLALGIVEALSQTRFPGQVGLFLCLIGIFIAWQGEGRARDAWPALVFLLFGLPLANGIQVILTGALQLVSSVGAVALIRAADIPVLREGNIVDLGAIQLQVAEACSGLRYLFPLATFSFLCAYLFVGNPLQRALIFLSSIPITIAMNILRIGVTGLLVDRFGVAAAEGFFHDFEGWIVYCACLALLFAEMKLLCYSGGSERSLLRRLDLDLPAARTSAEMASVETQKAAFLRWDWLSSAIAGGLILAALCAVVWIGARVPYLPARSAFMHFPREIGAWHAVDAPVDGKSLAALNATDHLSLNFLQGETALVNVWAAYYQSQYSGNAAHSPLVCIPGGGWQIESQDQVDLPYIDGAGTSVIQANRLIIAQGNMRQIVYYWFVEGGAVETNEYRAKARLLANSILQNRRDGALVRFIAPIEGGDVAAADAQLAGFVAETLPIIPQFLP
ncbi:VPLPA-CTERM-specific exosortase XrtD [Dongia sp.]|uniref:VPLPA-CTERM-specific exosortase XrtD n=1 Tax=Dongia sp. TaxID=1977262 RepID=UPI0035AE0C61